MNREPLFSIIVPVYNVEKLLPACIESIIYQSYKNFELILVVNDFSPDRCSEVCEKYAEQNSQIQVVHIKEGGVSVARNVGISYAKGKYLLFVDGDDFVADDSLRELRKTLKKDGDSDVIFLTAAHYFPDCSIHYFDDIFKKDKLYNKSKKDALAFISSLSDFNTSVCLKLIRREIVTANNILFAENITMAEDTDFSLKLFLHSQTFNYCYLYTYFYRKGRKGSATYDYSEKKYKDLLTVIAEWSIRAKEDPICSTFCEEVHNILAFQYCLLLSGYNKIEKPLRKKFKSDTKKYSWLLQKSKDSRVSIVKWCYRILGLRLTSMALTLRERFFA